MISVWFLPDFSEKIMVRDKTASSVPGKYQIFFHNLAYLQVEVL